MAIMLEFRFPRERDPCRVHDNPGCHSKDPVGLDLTRFFLVGEGVDGGVLGFVIRAVGFDGVVGAVDEELMHYSRLVSFVWFLVLIFDFWFSFRLLLG
jgi:hypothetical protein